MLKKKFHYLPNMRIRTKNLLHNKATIIHNVSKYNPQQNIFNSLKITKPTYKLP